MSEYTNERAVPVLLGLASVLLALALVGIAGGIERAGGQDHDTCEYPVDEITAAYIRGYNAGVEAIRNLPISEGDNG